MKKEYIKYIECKKCGSILEKEKTMYAMFNWIYCPLCGSDKVIFRFSKKDTTSKQFRIIRQPSKIRNRLKIGQYEPIKVEKGVNETVLERFGKPLKEGEIFWTIKLDNEGLFDVDNQDTAEIISRLVRVETKLNKLLSKRKKR